jgi:hypothetical protein
LAAVVSLAVACTGGDASGPNPASGSQPPLGGVVIVETGSDHSGYVVAFQECTKPGVASRLGIELHPDTVASAAIAEALAKTFPTEIQQDAMQGCLDALEGRGQRYDH